MKIDLEKELTTNGFRYENGKVGIAIYKDDKLIFADLKKESKLMWAYANVVKLGYIQKPESEKIRVYEQSLYENKIQGGLYRRLSDLGFQILRFEYDSFGPIYLIEIVKTNLQLPIWAEKY